MDAFSHLLLGFILSQALRLDGNLQLVLIVSSISLDIDGVSTSPEAAFRSHRGPLHSILAALLASTIVSLGYMIFMHLQTTALLVIPVSFAGFLSHVVLDMVTTGNMAALWPFSKRDFALNLTYYIDPTNLGALTIAALLAIYTRSDVSANRIVATATIAFLTASFGLRLYVKQAATKLIKRLDTDGASKIVALPTLRPDRWWIIRKTPFENEYSYEVYRIDPIYRRILSKDAVQSPYTSYSDPVEPPIDSPQKAVAHTRKDKRIGGSIEKFVLPKADVTTSSDRNTWQVFWYDAFTQGNKAKHRGIQANVRIDGTITIEARRSHGTRR